MDIYYFNPTCDYAIANGNRNWQPNLVLQKMEEDLDLISFYLAGANDTVILNKTPEDSFQNQFQKLNCNIPKIILKSDIGKTPLITEPIEFLKPWGWSPAVHKLFEPLKPFCSPGFKLSPVFNWNPEVRPFYSRVFSAGILATLAEELNDESVLPGQYFPKICRTQNEVEEAIAEWGNIMLKAPWSSSGRGLQPVTKTPVHQKVWEKINGIIREQGLIVAEPLLNKVHDLAFLFELKKGEISFSGISHFFTNKKGQYEGNFLNGLPPGLSEIGKFTDRIKVKLIDHLSRIILNSELPKYYEGVFGVDMLIFKDSENRLRINPCLEINLRFTMGFVALKLENLVDKNSQGVFRTFYDPQKYFDQFCSEMENKYPLKITNRKISSGFLPLNEPGKNTRFGAYLLVGQ